MLNFITVVIILFFKSKRYQDKMDQFSYEQSLYSKNEIEEIDDLIEKNMQIHLQSLIEYKIEALMQSEMRNYRPSPLLNPSVSIQQNICILFNHFCEEWTKKQQDYLSDMDCKIKETQLLKAQILQKDELIDKNMEELSLQKDSIQRLVKEEQLLNSTILSLQKKFTLLIAEKDEALSNQANQISKKDSIIINLTKQALELQQNLSKAAQQVERLKIERNEISIKYKDDLIKKNQIIANLQKECRSLKSTILNLKQQLAILVQDIAEKDQIINRQVEQLFKKDQIIANLAKEGHLLNQTIFNLKEQMTIGGNMSCCQKDNYKEKIISLNQIINYMINYSKGLENNQIRKGSWFMNQVVKHGQQYEARLMDPTHLTPKIKNRKIIESLCKQDNSCNKLIKEFQSIMDFYFSCLDKVSFPFPSESSSILKQNLNKTVNKIKIAQKPSHCLIYQS